MTLDVTRIRALCFDIDGTISDTDDLWVHKIEHFLKPIKTLFPSFHIQSFARRMMMSLESPGNAVYHILDRIGLDDEVASIFNWMAHHNFNRKTKTYWIIPNVKDSLIQLSKYYPMAVVSARDEESTRAFLEYFNLTALFQNITSAQTCAFTKPFPDPIIWAAHQMGVTPEECLMIGDTTVDILAGKAAGTQTAAVLCGFGEEKELKRAGADIILANIEKLTEILLAKISC